MLPNEVLIIILEHIRDLETVISWSNVNHNFQQIAKQYVKNIDESSKIYTTEILHFFPNLRVFKSNLQIRNNTDIYTLQRNKKLEYFKIHIDETFPISVLGACNSLNDKCFQVTRYNLVLDQTEKVWMGNGKLAGDAYLLPFIFMAKEWLEHILITSHMLFDNMHNLFISLLPNLKKITFVDEEMIGLISLIRINRNVESIECIITNTNMYLDVDIFVERLDFIAENIKELILPFRYSDAMEIKRFFPNLKTIGVREFNLKLLNNNNSDLFEEYEKVVFFTDLEINNFPGEIRRVKERGYEETREDWFLSTIN